MATIFDVTGAVGTPLTGLDSTTLASDFTPTTVSINNAGTAVGYGGVSLCTDHGGFPISNDGREERFPE
jgi:hypothetical protein